MDFGRKNGLCWSEQRHWSIALIQHSRHHMNGYKISTVEITWSRDAWPPPNKKCHTNAPIYLDHQHLKRNAIIQGYASQHGRDRISPRRANVIKATTSENERTIVQRSPCNALVINWISEIWWEFDRSIIIDSFDKCSITTDNKETFHRQLRHFHAIKLFYFLTAFSYII